MGNLSQFAVADDIVVEQEKDTLGGGGFILESNAYDMTIDTCHLSTSSGGASAVNFDFVKEDGSHWNHTLYFTNKKGENFYTDKKTGDKKLLPGYNIFNTICQLSLGKELSTLDTEDKVLNIYNYDAKAQVPTKVKCVTDLHGAKITLGIIKQIEDKNIKNDAGNYVPSGETKETNDISKIFRQADHKTKTEILAKEDSVFYDNWIEKFKDTVKDKSKGAKGGGVAGTPKASTTKTEALFD